MFGPDRRTQVLDLRALSPWNSFTAFLGHGVWHILVGLDHVLFLCTLILPSVMTRTDGRWEPVADIRSAAWNLLTIVTLPDRSLRGSAAGALSQQTATGLVKGPSKR